MHWQEAFRIKAYGMHVWSYHLRAPRGGQRLAYVGGATSLAYGYFPNVSGI